MKNSKPLLSLSFVTMMLLVNLTAFTQPTIPKENIPTDIDAGVRQKIESFYAANGVERGEAIRSLGKYRATLLKPAIPFLVAILHDDTGLQITNAYSPYGKPTSPGEEAARILGKIGEPAVDPLIQALQSEDYHTRRCASIGLGMIKDPRAVEPLINLLDTEPINVVLKAAIEALTEIADPRIADPLYAVYLNEEPTLSKLALEGLIKIKDKRAVDVLVEQMNSDNVSDAEYAIRNLGDMGDIRALTPLIALLHKLDWKSGARDMGDVLENLVRSLPEPEVLLADSTTVPSLISLLHHEDSFVRSNVAASLNVITDQDFGFRNNRDPNKWQEWWDHNKNKYIEIDN